jgi:hypothetical protein
MPTLASNDAAGPTLGLPLLVALRLQVTTGHSVGRGHSPLMLWAARLSVACSCLRSGASPPLLDNAFRRDPLCSPEANAAYSVPEARDRAAEDTP